MTNQNENNTKYRFLIEALRLFSEKGYKAVSVAEIANAVGCSAPALYKHYKSKQELLLAIFEESNKGFREQMRQFKLETDDAEVIRQRLLNMTDDEQVYRIQNLVRHALHNEFAQAFRKMCAVEQFHMKELAQIYTYRYYTFQTEQCEKVFKILMDGGVLKKADPKTLAISYMSLPILAVGICDREPEREDEMMQLIDNHVREFLRVYKA